MKRLVALAALVVFCVGAETGVAAAKPQSVKHGNTTYYVVTSTDAAMDTGTEVCAAMGGQCVGYTGFSNDICKRQHPNAKTKSDASGSKASFYCDGPPQGGVCASETNTCHICPNCNVGVTCDESIGGLYREMYVECSGGEIPETIQAPAWWKSVFSKPGRWWDGMRDTVQRAFDRYRDILGRLTMKAVKHVVVQVQGPNGTVNADIPEDSLVCEFYQKNKKLVTCGALSAADQFCVEAFGSRFATAALCQDNGVIICSKPCTTNPAEVKPQRCAFDGDRPRGNQAPPLDFCTETVSIDTKDVGSKKAGAECRHGGECGTGICLGQPSDNGIKYFCSCSQTRHDTSCGK